MLCAREVSGVRAVWEGGECPRKVSAGGTGTGAACQEETSTWTPTAFLGHITTSLPRPNYPTPLTGHHLLSVSTTKHCTLYPYHFLPMLSTAPNPIQPILYSSADALLSGLSFFCSEVAVTTKDEAEEEEKLESQLVTGWRKEEAVCVYVCVL